MFSTTYGTSVLGSHTQTAGRDPEEVRNEQRHDTLIYGNTQHVTSRSGTCGQENECIRENEESNEGVMSNRNRSLRFRRRNEC